MELMKTSTYSQGSDLWKAQPISLNCPVVVLPEMPIEVHTVAASSRGIAGGVHAPQRARSHKPEKLKADVIADRIHATVARAGSNEDNSPKPTNEVMAKAINLIGSVKDALLGDPEVDASYGEIHLTWQKGTKQVVLMCFPDNRNSLVHHYQKMKGTSSKHAIEQASVKRLTHWLRWLHE